MAIDQDMNGAGNSQVRMEIFHGTKKYGSPFQVPKTAMVIHIFLVPFGTQAGGVFLDP